MREQFQVKVESTFQHDSTATLVIDVHTEDLKPGREQIGHELRAHLTRHIERALGGFRSNRCRIRDGRWVHEQVQEEIKSLATAIMANRDVQVTGAAPVAKVKRPPLKRKGVSAVDKLDT